MDEAELVWELQKEAFAELLEKYQDHETSPGNEHIDRITARMNQSFTYYYLICADHEIVGAIRVVDEKNGNKKTHSAYIHPATILEYGARTNGNTSR